MSEPPSKQQMSKPTMRRSFSLLGMEQQTIVSKVPLKYLKQITIINVGVKTFESSMEADEISKEPKNEFDDSRNGLEHI